VPPLDFLISARFDGRQARTTDEIKVKGELQTCAQPRDQGHLALIAGPAHAPQPKNRKSDVYRLWPDAHTTWAMGKLSADRKLSGNGLGGRQLGSRCQLVL